MANAFSKEEIVAFEQILEGFQDAEVLSRNVAKFNTDAQMMERANDTIWRPMPYIAQSFDGMDQTSNFVDNTQLSVPARIGFSKSSPWIMDAKQLRDAQGRRLLSHSPGFAAAMEDFRRRVRDNDFGVPLTTEEGRAALLGDIA